MSLFWLNPNKAELVTLKSRKIFRRHIVELDALLLALQCPSDASRFVMIFSCTLWRSRTAILGRSNLLFIICCKRHRPFFYESVKPPTHNHSISRNFSVFYNQTRKLRKVTIFCIDVNAAAIVWFDHGQSKPLISTSSILTFA